MLALLATGLSHDEILKEAPDLEAGDTTAALAFASRRVHSTLSPSLTRWWGRTMLGVARKLLLGLASMALAACATPYVEPSSGERARVRFVVEEGAPVEMRDWADQARSFVFAYDDTDCTAEVFVTFIVTGFNINPQPRRLGMPLWEYQENSANEFYFGATPTYLMFVGQSIGSNGISSTHYSCAVFIRTVFEANKDYELTYRMDRGRRCQVNAVEIVLNGGGAERRHVETFYGNLPSAGCERVFRTH